MSYIEIPVSEFSFKGLKDSNFIGKIMHAKKDKPLV
jgi:hypothetical protein